jgi:hypothetical protein
LTLSLPQNKIIFGWATDEEVKETVIDSLNGLVVVDFYDQGIVRLVQRLNKCRITKGIT